MLAVTYMGTKRHLAPTVAQVVRESSPGAFLDLFSGMCSVGQAIAPSRQVWSNDLQIFASIVAKCQFCSVAPPPSSALAGKQLREAFARHEKELTSSSSNLLKSEKFALDGRDIERLRKLFEDSISKANQLSYGYGAAHYRLFLDRYSCNYFGAKQSIEIDALRKAIDYMSKNEDEKNWYLVALCGAMSRCANTTGHFAQPLNPKESNLAKVLQQRKRSIWGEFRAALDRLVVFGTADWRISNRVFRSDASELLDKLDSEKIGVVYADPPYTSDQYSRYYHLYETAILYDHPAARGRGLYRDGRPISKFCHKRQVQMSIEKIVSSTASLGADLILSYPSNGLLENSRAAITLMIKKHFCEIPEVLPVKHNHSTMGASKGDARLQVTELIFIARR